MNIQDIKCPICMDLPLYPRLYECGHTICEICMKNNDHAECDRNYDIFQATNFSCPICRHSSITPWYLRPINRSLLDILLKNEKYVEKYEEYTKKRIDISPEDIKIPENIDLSFISRQKRHQKAEKLYKKIIPLLFEAATYGKTYITITRDAEDIKIVGEILVEKLFNHNIHKVITSSRECTIEIVPSEKNFNCEYENESYDESNNNTLFPDTRVENSNNLSSINLSLASLSTHTSPVSSPSRISLSPRRRNRNY
jgi:hypothetical protein